MNEARPPTTDLTTDTALIRAYVSNLTNNDHKVVVLMHSYGGQVGTNALAGLSGVRHLIYMCASAFKTGATMLDYVRDFEHMDLMPLVFDYADDGSVVVRDPKTTLLGPVTDEAETETYLKSLVRWNGKCMDQPLTACAWKEIPVTYVHTKLDMTVPFVYQEKMVEEMRKEGVEVETVVLEGGHCPNLTMTGEVVGVVEGVAAKMAG